MLVTVSKIVRIWPDSGRPNSYLIVLALNPDGSVLSDSISYNESAETLTNEFLGQYVYVCDPVDVSNNIVLGPEGRRTGRLILWNDGNIRIAQNNHTEIGRRVELE